MPKIGGELERNRMRLISGSLAHPILGLTSSPLATVAVGRALNCRDFKRAKERNLVIVELGNSVQG